MGEEGTESDSSSELPRSAGKRSRRPKEPRVCNRSRTPTSFQDPMPEFVDPELVNLIAQNAPFELDLFLRSLPKSAKRRAETGGMRSEAMGKDDGRVSAVEAILSSVRERNEHLAASKGGRSVRHSCPERMWSDSEQENESIWRAKAVKRKRPKSLDPGHPPTLDTGHGSEVSFSGSEKKETSELQVADLAGKVASPKSSDQGFNRVAEKCLPPFKSKAFGVPSVQILHVVGKDCRLTDAKPWRRGMRKGKLSTKEDKPESTPCERRIESDSRKNCEVRKRMETKEIQGRKEQQQLKEEAEAAFSARKKRQQKLDLHRQMTMQTQLTGGKSGDDTLRPPAWTSGHTAHGGPPRPWSSSSSGELSMDLPPPVTPPKLEPVPLDLYTSRFQDSEGHPPTPKVGGNEVCDSQPRERQPSKKVKGCSRELQKQLKYMKSKMLMMSHPHNDLNVTELANAPVVRKARWKAIVKPFGRKLSSEEISQLQMAEHKDASFPEFLNLVMGRRYRDLEVYKRSLRRQFNLDGVSRCKAEKVNQVPKYPKRSSDNLFSKSMLHAENCAMPAFKDQACISSKVERLKSTQHFTALEAKELSVKEIATLLNSDCESESPITEYEKMIAERMLVRTRQAPLMSRPERHSDLRKCVGHSLRSPQKHVIREDVLQNRFGPAFGSPERVLTDEDVLCRNTDHQSGSPTKPFRNKEVVLQVNNITKEAAGDPHRENRGKRGPSEAVQKQRMRLLKSLAERLVNRADVACAKKHELESSSVKHSKRISLESYLNSNTEAFVQLDRLGSVRNVESLKQEMNFQYHPKQQIVVPLAQPAGSFLDNQSLQPELKFLHQTKQDILYCCGLTELEQAGCDVLSVQKDKNELKVELGIPNPTLGGIDHTAATAPVSAIFTVMDWNSADKGMEISSNIPSACTSFPPSSPSTGSSSPVILPMTTKYHMGRIKHGKMVSKEEQIRQAKKEDWTLPVVNETHSIINLYTQHWKLKEREKLASSAYPHVAQSVLEGKIMSKNQAGILPARFVAEEVESTYASVPECQKLSISEFNSKSPESKDEQAIQSVDCCYKHRQFPQGDRRGIECRCKQSISSSNCESLRVGSEAADISTATCSADHAKAWMESKEFTGNSGPKEPEVILVEIGDLKLCQSPTTFHVR